MTVPRGIRNNNPGNIRSGAAHWQGARANGFDPEFVEFKNPLWGLRALMKVLLTYHRKHGLNTVGAVINRWAPPHENATDHYAAHVARRLRVGRNDMIDIEDPFVLIELAKAIAVHENGRPPKGAPRNWYDEESYFRAAALALGREIRFAPVMPVETKAAAPAYA